MVCWRMGLLDDAIREHLELKRRRGADPGEVARSEREALDPAFPEESAQPEDVLPAASEGVFGDHGEVAAERSAPTDAAELEVGAGISSSGQETAELDMLSVLDEQPEAPTTSSSAPPVFAGQLRDAPPAGPPEDSPEWEMPGTSEKVAGGSLGEGAGSDRDPVEEPWGSEESRPAGAGTDPDHRADVPGQERLTFE